MLLIEDVSTVVGKDLQISSSLNHMVPKKMKIKLFFSDLASSNSNRMWTSIDLEQKYTTLKGSRFTRKKNVECILEEYKNDIMQWFSPGRTNILIFNSAANEKLRVQDLDDEDEVQVHFAAKSIAIDIKGIHFDKNVYQTKVDLFSSQQDVSPALTELLKYVSLSLSKDLLEAVFVRNIIISIFAKTYTSFQLALVVNLCYQLIFNFSLQLMIDKKLIIEYLYDLGVTCSYHELIRFCTSAAMWTANRQISDIIGNYKQGLVQVVTNIFDCNISSMNGKKETHAVAMILVQTGNSDSRNIDQATMEIPRLKKEDLKDSDKQSC